MRKIRALIGATIAAMTIAAVPAAAEQVYYLNFKPEADEAWQPTPRRPAFR